MAPLASTCLTRGAGVCLPAALEGALLLVDYEDAFGRWDDRSQAVVGRIRDSPRTPHEGLLSVGAAGLELSAHRLSTVGFYPIQYGRFPSCGMP